MSDKFSLGQTVITRAADQVLDRLEVLAFLRKHVTGDWGDVCEEDRKANDQALEKGERLLSVYSDCQGTKFWIITEWDRSYTTILLPSDY